MRQACDKEKGSQRIPSQNRTNNWFRKLTKNNESDQSQNKNKAIPESANLIYIQLKRLSHAVIKPVLASINVLSTHQIKVNLVFIMDKSEVSPRLQCNHQKHFQRAQPYRKDLNIRFINWPSGTQFRLELDGKMLSNLWLLSALLLGLCFQSSHSRSVINHARDLTREFSNDRPIIGKVISLLLYYLFVNTNSQDVFNKLIQSFHF